MNNRIINSQSILFLGAGASSPLGLKPTAPFLELLPSRLEDRIKSGTTFGERGMRNLLSPLFTQAAEHYNTKLPDCEVLLDYIDFIDKSCRKLGELPEDFAKLAQCQNAKGFFTHFATFYSKIREHIQELVVEHYSKVDGEEALLLYRPLLDILCSKGEILPIFTTNYDWVFEYLVEASNDITPIRLVDGFKEHSMGALLTRNVFDNFRINKKKRNLVLFKLHGSTSWYRDVTDSKLIFKFPNTSPNLAGSRAVLIYPTQTKTSSVKDEPFSIAYDYLKESLLNVKNVIVIGFSFRDTEINGIFSDAFRENSGMKVTIVNPEISEENTEAFEEFLFNLGVPKYHWRDRIYIIRDKFGQSERVINEIDSSLSKK